MTRIVLTAFILAIGFNHVTIGQAAVVRDPYKQRQLENMVFMRWGGFKPKWYYFLFHNKYRKGPDRRTILQLVPTDLVVGQTKEKSEEEGEDAEIMYTQEIWDATNRQLDLHYTFHFKPIFEKLNQDIIQLIDRANSLSADPSAIQSFRKELERLNNEIEIIRNGWLERGDSAEAMKDIELDLQSLRGRIIRFNQLQEINFHYSTIQP
jgi:FtsZ-binding cell division protein ZapB